MTLKREIKDAYIENGDSIYVKTHSNAIYVDDNETETLTQRLDNVKDSIKEHTSQLDTIVRDTEKNFDSLYKNNLRIFKPTFGFNALGTPCSDCRTFESQKIMLDTMKDIGVTDFAYCVKVNEDESGLMTIGEDLNMVNQCIEYCKSNGLTISSIHVYVNQEFNTVTSNFNAQYKNMITEILNLFNDVDYEYFIVWNEATTRIINTVVKNTVLECMDIVKAKNKKVGIATMGVSPFGYISQNLFDKSDFICFNHYNYISYKHENTSIQDGIDSWTNGYLNDVINYAKNKYPDKDIIIGESGIVMSWECLFNPASIAKSSKTYDYTGKVLEIYYTGLLECLKNSIVKYVYGWFPHDFVSNKTVMKQLLNKYVNGGRNYE